ncbi:MAG TPA: hypothetical protein VNI55_04535 [Gaiellaceae bacterium]|nr:hypothetical protein [Gaiellaceae bacterium]
MIGLTRGFSTLVGVGVAGFLIWLAAQTGQGTSGEYWATYGLIAAAGLTIALSQILGGWTKGGWPRLSLGVFLLGFLPALVAGGWVLLARQPADFFNTSNWSRDLGIDPVVSDLGELLAAVAFGIGLTFGLTFDTSGPRRHVDVEERTIETPRPTPAADVRSGDVRNDVRNDVRDADEPLTAERTSGLEDAENDRGRRFGFRRSVPAGSQRGDDES